MYMYVLIVQRLPVLFLLYYLGGIQVPDVSEPAALPSTSLAISQYLSYKLVADNLDKNIKARYLRVEGRRNQSLHYFHAIAVRDRIDFSSLPDVLPHSCLNSPKERALALLPSKDDDKALKQLFGTHVSRILAKHIPFFKLTFEDVIDWHIEHEYYKEMSAASQVVSITTTKRGPCCRYTHEFLHTICRYHLEFSTRTKTSWTTWWTS